MQFTLDVVAENGYQLTTRDAVLAGLHAHAAAGTGGQPAAHPDHLGKQGMPVPAPFVYTQHTGQLPIIEWTGIQAVRAQGAASKQGQDRADIPGFPGLAVDQSRALNRSPVNELPEHHLAMDHLPLGRNLISHLL
jgi:hypothetical protein